jgi:hypothetical protein
MPHDSSAVNPAAAAAASSSVGATSRISGASAHRLVKGDGETASWPGLGRWIAHVSLAAARSLSGS